jgi:regulator of sigma E protease
MVLPRFAVVLGIMVVVHELGHFIVAKLCGVRVEAFAVGFGKRLFGVVHNGTDYCVNLVPLGGYVKMAGVGDEPVSGSEQTRATLDPGELQNHPRWQRALIAVAGPVANFILAFVLMACAYMFDNQVPEFFRQPAVANYVSPNSPMARTGIQPGDTIVFFDNQQNPTWGEILERAPANFNSQTPFGYLHNGQRVMSKLLVEAKDTTRPEDFDFQKLGMIPMAQTVPVQVDSLADNTSPAARAGMKPGDKILAVDDQHPRSVDALLAYLQDQAGKPAQVTVERMVNGKPTTLNLTVLPTQGETKLGKAWMLGIKTVPPPVTVEPMDLGKALNASYVDNLKNSQLIFDVLHRLFTRQVSVKSLSSPVGMSVQVNEAFEQQGWFPIIATMAMISLNLGIFNLLPIPILDGGMIVFLFIESLIRRDLNQQVKERVYQVAFVCLVLFAAVVIFNDITKLLPVHVKS